MNVIGFSHVTINVSDLSRSVSFYTDKLKMKLRHQGNKDAYLEWGDAWICLIQKEEVSSDNNDREMPSLGVDHVAFYISEDDFQGVVQRIEQEGIVIVRGPVQRGLGWSVNFLDPDGTELELHTSNLEERMKVWK